MTMALIKVERYSHNPDCEISKVYVRDEFFCYAIEDASRPVKIQNETCIPLGTYDLGTRFSPHFSPIFNHDMIWVQNVPDYEFVLIHHGNTILDTDGCLLVGQTVGTLQTADGVVRDAVLTSKPTYLNLYAAVIDDIKAGGQQIEYVSV